MADIRQTTVILDDFNRAAEDPILPPWYQATTSFGSNPCRLSGNAIGGRVFPPTSSVSYWATESYNGDDAEVWATAMGSAPQAEGWRMGLMHDMGGASIDGYQCLMHNGVGPDTWFIRKMTNATFYTMASVVHALPIGGVEMCLMRCKGTQVEVWSSVDAGANWTLIVSATDSTYRTDLYAALGSTGKACGWDNFGAGATLNPWVPQYIRRTHLRGGR
jgi:hypothetical protein